VQRNILHGMHSILAAAIDSIQTFNGKSLLHTSGPPRPCLNLSDLIRN
jgi:hypothetical protein